MTTTYKSGAKVAGMYMTGSGGLCWDPSGMITKCDAKQIAVTYVDGQEKSYSLPASDFIDYLRICTACGKPSTFKLCIGNGGCGASTEGAV